MVKKNSETEEPNITAGKIMAHITGAAAIVILTIFPLFYRDKYFDILDAKYQFYYITILAMIAAAFAAAIIFLYQDGSRYRWNDTKAFFNKFSKGNIRQTVTSSNLWGIVFLIIAAIATFQSDYFYESFWGNEGRYTGLFLLILYVVSFLLISNYARLHQWYLDAFLLAAIFVCLFGITDYFKMNIMDFKTGMLPEDWFRFTSTIGNINTYTAYISLVMGCAAALLILEKKKIRMVWYYICVVIAFYALITGGSDNAYLAILALFGFLPLCAFKDWQGIKRYCILLATVLTIIYLAGKVDIALGDQVERLEGLFEVLINTSFLLYGVIASWLLAAGVYLFQYYKKDHLPAIGVWPRYIWLGLILLVVLVVGYLFYDVNIAGNAAKYPGMQQYLLFGDHWGTNRGGIWRIAMECYQKFPLHHKIFGYGPDTFGIMTKNWFYQEMLTLSGNIYDSAHNEYLQYFITIGPIGLFAYLGLLISSGMQMLRSAKTTPYLLGIFFAVLCYGAQAVVNINLPIATPVMWMLLALGTAKPHRA